MNSIWTRLALTLRIICAVALVSIGFAENAQAGARNIPTAELAQYVLPDGTLPELCVTLDDGSGDGKIVRLGSDTLGAHHHDAVLPPPHAGGPYVLPNAERVFPPRHIDIRIALHPPGCGPRAPPSKPSLI